MEVILDGLINDEILLSGDDRDYSLSVIESALQSDKKDYESYFSSNPVAGSVVEEIAELENHISTIEKRIKTNLIQNKDAVIKCIFNSNGRSKTAQLQEQINLILQYGALHQTEEQDSFTEKKNHASVDVLLNFNLKADKGPSNPMIDDFQTALKSLKAKSVSTKDKIGIGEDNLVVVLENLSDITQIMELPYLTKTCIKTGHYQEAIALHGYVSTLQTKFPNSIIVDHVKRNVSEEIKHTMLTGLVRMLSTNINMNSIKKILECLGRIEPLNDNHSQSLLAVYLSMRYTFIEKEIGSYVIEDAAASEYLIEMIMKRKIEVLREHAYVALNVYNRAFSVVGSDLKLEMNTELSRGLHVETTSDSTLDNFKNEANALHGGDFEARVTDDDGTGDTAMEESTRGSSPHISDENESSRQGQVQSPINPMKTDDSGTKESDGNSDQIMSNQASEQGCKQYDEFNADVPISENAQTEKQNDFSTSISTNVKGLGPERDLKLSDSRKSKPDIHNSNQIKTNPIMLQFIDQCISCLISSIKSCQLPHHEISDSVCLQLIYCSFRLQDLNENYHVLFLNKLQESALFTTAQLCNAIRQRSKLAARYTYV